MQEKTKGHTHIRCSAPDCDWGYEAYRAHCIELHGIRPDAESYMDFDLEKLMLSMFQR
jgi:hypothetical protein